VREVCAQLTQTVPKAIVHCMVLSVSTSLQGHLLMTAPVATPEAVVLADGAAGGYSLETQRAPSSQSKDKLLEEMSASVAGDQEAALKRLLGEDETVMRRREALTHKLDMLRRAQLELSSVDV
jgi:hypothetical protein